MQLTRLDSILPDEHREASGDRVVITGAGLVTCLGLDRRSTWSRVLRGENGFRTLTEIESQLPPEKTGGQAPGLSPDEGDGSAREVSYLRRALREALREAQASDGLPYSSKRCGLVLGTTLHGMRHAGRFLRTGDFGALGSFLSSSTLRDAAEGLGLNGFATTLCSACSSGLASINAATTLLQAGVLDLVVAGGYDAISEYAYGGFSSMRLITDSWPRPFSRNRDGMKLGEGYAVVVLERESQAIARGCDPLAEILGFGESCDAYHLSKPHPEGAGAATAIATALQRANLSAQDIDAIAAHATATPENDAAEFSALTSVFSDALRSIPVVAFKSHLGHTLGAAGAVELILSMTALCEQVIPPTAHVVTDELAYPGLCLSNGRPRKANLRNTVNTSLGFGGCNSSVVLGRSKAARGDQRTRSPAVGENRVAITGMGVVFPGVIGIDALCRRVTDAGPDSLQESTGTIPADQLDSLLQTRRARRISEYVRLTLAATSLAYENAGITDFASFGEGCSAVLGTNHGSAGFSAEYYRKIVNEGLSAANPMLFAEGVPNAAAAHLSTTMSIKGLCQTAIGTRTAGLEALCLAASRIRTGVWTRAIVSAADEFYPLVNEAYHSFNLLNDPSKPREPGRDRGFVSGCGAVTLVLEQETSALRRGASLWGTIEKVSANRCSNPGSRCGPDAVSGVWSALGRSAHIMGSANHTWIDRLERSALGRRTDNDPQGPIVSSIYGHIAECFSAGPLAALAAVLIRGKLPCWRVGPPGRLRVADGSEAAERFGIITTDYAGSVVGVGVQRTVDGRKPCEREVLDS